MKRGVFVTGANGFLGSYAVDWILRNTELRLFLLLRAPDDRAALGRLWEALQFHRDEDGFSRALPRITIVRGDLHAPGLGLSAPDRERIVAEADSVLHVAASLNRKSDKACFNTNLRGTLSVLKLALQMQERGELARFTDVSTVAVAGHRQSEVVTEDGTVDWNRSDYDPYARTKKFAEHLAHELLPPEKVLVLRPSTVMGDGKRDKAWMTDMVRAFVALADLPVVPLDPRLRMDIVPGDFVGEAIAKLHTKPELRWRAYNLAAGDGSATYESIARAMSLSLARPMRFEPRLGGPFAWSIRAANRLPRGPAQQLGAVMKVFWPYLVYDTVFDNTRVVAELGERPARFEAYAAGLYTYAKRVGLKNPVRPLV